jgi:hypothetical protein
MIPTSNLISPSDGIDCNSTAIGVSDRQNPNVNADITAVEHRKEVQWLPVPIGTLPLSCEVALLRLIRERKISSLTIVHPWSGGEVYLISADLVRFLEQVGFSIFEAFTEEDE